MRNLILTLFLSILTIPLQAVDKNPTEFENAIQEQRYQTLIEELRCIQCQNQSIADSNADIAQDIRELVRTKVLAEQTDDEIVNFLVERYGDFVLYNPPFKTTTYLLWLSPFLLLFGALFLLRYFIQYHSQETIPTDFTVAEQEKLRKALNKGDKS